MNKIILLILLVVLAALCGCETESPLIAESELLVVRAYLFADEAVNDIQLTNTYELGTDTTAGAPVNDAVVTLEKAGQIYQLTRSPGDSGYYHYPGNDLQVNVGDTFRISIEHSGQIVTSETAIPAPPENVDISSDEFLIDLDTFVRFDTSSITVRWKNENESFYFVAVANLESSPVAIDERFGQFLERFRSFRSAPTNADTFIIRRLDLTFLGQHRARVYKVNQEYADLFVFGTQDSRNLNEPLTNINNGLGIFAGFSSGEINFVVAAK
jgi:hypothetical protein